ncbi:gluconate 2-dehydrogenase subunit 3 family protein [Paenibacillus flagellatus]|uniref:Gluconate 2-dehydrogenase subunit 3 family protein n=1 Tax=Paenibacillus flagellatus TaxID=2211139 RepID=A0A2V5JWV0_9BACL|nr:gluconate 2-dehydrogenase subunit 3 family protein [Paenibacillus flagellatus]PYI51279.1 hypothetical protein DLM86_24935 [Paenibacillus flagellatus]
MKKTRYPNYDVLTEQKEWDDHTRAIVLSRTEGVHSYRSLSLVEAEMLRAICAVLAGDDRANIIQFVLVHIDRTLSSPSAESERKASEPEAAELVHLGLKRLDHWCVSRHKRPFIDLTATDQHSIVLEMGEEKLALPPDYAFPQKALFNKLLSWTVESYYSHPTVWSEIGYGGPAYPRGYVRANIGQLDPWEARTDT